MILGLLGIESIINGSLFASGSAQGIFGGWSIAVLISAVNVIFGFMVGAYWGKQAWSIHIPMKFIGLIGLSVWASFTVAFNLAVGHIRSVYEESANLVNLGEASIISSQGFDPWRDGFINFLANPIGLENFLSWVLVFVGILFAIIALFDGLKIDDKYPGYGPIVKKLKAAQEELHYEVDELKNSSSNYADEYLEKGDTERRRLNQEAIALRENHDFTKERVKQEYPKYCNYYAENFKNLINAYRNYNMDARFDEPPEYFSKEPSFDWDTNNRDEQLDKLSNKIDEIRDKAMQEAERWAATRQELESIKKEFLEKQDSMIQSARKRRKNKRYNGDFGIVSLLTIGGTSYYFIQANNDPLDEFQCSIKNGPNEVTAIIFDKSQTYTNDQVTDIKTSFDLWLTGSEAITKNRSIDLSFFEQGNLIQLYVTDQVNLDKPDGLEPLTQLCVPKDFREANEWIENPIS